MATPRSLPARIGAVLVGLLLVAVVAGGALAVGSGRTAVQATSDGISMSAAGTTRTWFGLEIRNPSAVPARLRFVRALEATNARIVDARVLDRRGSRDSGVGVLSPPVEGAPGIAIARSRPVDGFLLPPHSGDRYQLIVLVERVRPGAPAVLRRTDIGYSALGLDQGFRSGAVLRIRASSAAER